MRGTSGKSTAAMIMLGIALGVPAGIGVFTFVYARGASYLSNDPAVCANCHVMQSHYDRWLKSSHRSVAVCNDCHTPPGFVGKYATKGENGFWHSFYFTTGWFPDNIQIRQRNLKVTESACRKCHTDITEAVDGPHKRGDDALSCVGCHNSVGHME